MNLRERFRDVDFKDVLVLLAMALLVVGLALIYLPAALIIPSSLLLALGFVRKWY